MNESVMIEDIKHGTISLFRRNQPLWSYYVSARMHYHKFEVSPAFFPASIFPVAHIPEVWGDLWVSRVAASQ